MARLIVGRRARQASIAKQGHSVSVAETQIRNAALSDMAVLRDLYRRASLSNPGDRASLLSNPDVLEFADQAVRQGRTRVAIADGRIVGFASTVVGDTAVEVEDLFVDPAWMRRGVGLALVVDMIVTAQAQGCRRLEVTANEHARAFYARAGFVDDGPVDTRFGPAPRMHLDIAG